MRLAIRIATLIAGLVSIVSLASTSATGTGSRERHRETERGPEAGRERFSSAPTVDPQAPMRGEISRRILALYDSTENVSPETALLHTLAELPLNHLGLVLDWHDVNTPLPDTSRHRGVITWFGDERMRDPQTYLRWLARQPRVVIMERLGAHEDLEGRKAPRELVDAAMRAAGGSHVGDWTDDSSLINVVHSDRSVIGFERPLPARLGFYERYVAAPSMRVHLAIERTDRPLGDSRSDAVWTGPRGGFVMPGAAFTEDRLGDRYVTRWILDPFRFFEAAFGVEGEPRPDFTTLNGERIFYSQVDGDGLDSLTELDYRSRCGEIVRDQIFKHYDLPFTASVVVGLTAPPPIGRGTTIDREVARSIFALDNIEVGSHGFAHPLDWRSTKPEELSVQIPGYTATGEGEIAKSVEYIDRELAPPGKRCRIMLWTGHCNPSPRQLKVAYDLGLRNLNGGDPRMDAHFPSYAHLVPPVHRVGTLAQYFTSAANDYILTDDWQPPYYRFQNVVQTFERSAAPRRVVPVDVYFHFYSARNQAALVGLKRALDWVAARPHALLYASQYVDIVRDFEHVRIARESASRFVIRKGAALRTVRFDDPELHVDLSASQGVIGYRQEPSLHATYVHLDASPEARIVTSREPARQPRLERGTHLIDAIHLDDDGAILDVMTQGAGVRRFTFGGLKSGQRYRINAESEATVDEHGRLEVSSRAPRLQVVRI